jgi:hypothetical protein
MSDWPGLGRAMLALLALASGCATASTGPADASRPALIFSGQARVGKIDGQSAVPRMVKGRADGIEVAPGFHRLEVTLWIYRRLPPLLVDRQIVPYGPVEVCLRAHPGRRYTVDQGAVDHGRGPEFPPPVIVDQGTGERVERVCALDGADE